jgi:acyl carrier protein
MSIEETVKELLIDDIGIEEDVKMDSRLKEDLGVDSTELVEIIAALEKKFKIKIPEGIIGLKSNVREIVEYLGSFSSTPLPKGG